MNQTAPDIYDPALRKRTKIQNIKILLVKVKYPWQETSLSGVVLAKRVGGSGFEPEYYKQKEKDPIRRYLAASS